MIYFVLSQTLLIIILFVLIVKKTGLFSKKSAQNGKKGNKEDLLKKTPNFTGPNLRKSFRVTLKNHDCLVEILGFENKILNHIKRKGFKGHLDNISTKGLKLMCSYDLPVKQSIIIQTTFSLKDHEFCLKGEIVRKEEHNNKNINGYGVKFLDLSDDEQKLLNIVLNQIILEERKKII